ncbi:MAG: PrpR N-terminal domain-containing protein [Synergistaceae bacterium]|jgi:transcriptional regulator with PAS, ATPase and Fis domain|nr:PrpR N-terminal domain-containing protein [Synergistaceae bacterium]
MDKVKILGIAPYAGMKELMQDIAARRGDIDLEVFVGDLSNGVDIVLERQGQGFSAIVSRGGTAEMIKRATDIPVSEVPLSVYDVLRAIRLAQNYNGRFAIVGFPSITRCSHLLCDILQYDSIDIVTINGRDEIKTCLETLKKQGYSIVVGDMTTTIQAKLLGINSILITSGGESIEAAFSHAVEICERNRKNLEKIEFLNAVLGSVKEDIVVFCEGGEAVFSSFSAGCDSETLSFMKKNIRPVLERHEKKILKKNDKGDVYSLSGRAFGVKFGVKEERYCAYFAARLPSTHPYNERGIAYNNKANLLEDVDNTFCKNLFVEGLNETAEKYSKSALPVLIAGEIGTGKDKTANFVYMNGHFSDNPMISIDCGVVPEKTWKRLMEDEFSPLADEGLTIYVKNTDRLDELMGDRLIRYFRDTNICERNCLIFSFVSKIRSSEENPFLANLRNTLRCLVLKMPPLRQRPGDIPNLCSLYINEINTTTGGEVIGLTPEAMRLMMEYRWEYNLGQLKRVLTELAVLSASPYISAEEVERALATESALTRGDRQNFDNQACALDLGKSLENITSDIVRIVLSQENMNQSKAARRLGISRSTLWRMLNKQQQVL